MGSQVIIEDEFTFQDIHEIKLKHDTSTCPVCHPDREYSPHTCEHCGKEMVWADQSCACLCRSNKGYQNG